MTHTTRTRYACEVSKPPWGRLTAAVVCLVALSGVNLLLPLAPKKAIDDVFPSGDMGRLVVLLVGLLGVYLARNLFYFLAGHLTNQVAGRVAFDLRSKLLARMGALSLDFYDKHKPGKLTSRVLDDVAAVQAFVQKQAVRLIIDGLMLGGVIVVVFCMNWRLAAAAIAVFPMHILACALSRRRIQERTVATREHRAAMASSLIDLVTRAAAIKAAGAQQREARSFMHTMRNAFTANMSLASATLQQKVVADLLVGLGTVGVFCYGGHMVACADMSVGSFVAFYGYIVTLYPLTARLASSVPAALGAVTSFDRVVELLEHAPDETPGILEGQEADFTGDVEFSGVSFGYDTAHTVLDNVTFRVRAGERVMVTGANGSGKSALLSLLPRFRQPSEGQVLVSGRDVASIPAQTLRQRIGFVFQELQLFDTTVRENIRYARPEATEAEVHDAAQAAGAHEFIERLPQGYDTLLGMEGVRLSLGQRQRIALAQALLKSPSILVIDDVFASLDADSRQTIWANVDKAMAGGTIIVAAGDPESVGDVDRVLRLHEGRVLEVRTRQTQRAA